MKKTKNLMILMILSIALISGCTTGDVVDTPAPVDAGNVFEDDPNKVTMYFFWGDGCPYCADQKPFIEEWKNKYSELVVKEFEVYYVKENQQHYQEIAEVYGMRAGPVPVTFIGDEHWTGFSERMVPEIEAKIQDCINNGCESPGSRVLNK